MNYLVRDREVIFNLAGQVSHIDSMRDPYTDLEINCRSQLSMLEACRQSQPGGEGRLRRHAPGLRQARSPAGRRDATWCGRPTSTASTRPPASTTTCVYNNVFGVRACSLRLTNVYGPRQLIKHNRQGFIGWFIRLAIEDRRDPDLRRRLADARLRLRGRCGRRVPAGGRVRRVRRRGVQRRRRREPIAPSRSGRRC